MKNIRTEIQNLSSKSADSAERLFEQGSQQLYSGDLKKALASFDKALKLQPNNANGLYVRGVVLSQMSRYKDAIISLDKALAISPTHHDALNLQAITLGHINHHEKALTSFDKALEVKPDSHIAWINRGITLCDHLALYEEAIISFDEALKLKSDFHEAWYNKGVALDHLCRYEEAFICFDKSLDFKPYFFEALHKVWLSRGEALRHLWRYEEAIASYDKALDLKPNFFEAWHSRGFAVLLSIAHNSFPAVVIKATLSQHQPQLNQRGYSGQVITLETGLIHLIPNSEEWGILQSALGEAHLLRGKLEELRGYNPSPYWRKARYCLELALSALSIETSPQPRLKAFKYMIRVLLSQGDITLAQTYCKTGIELLKTLLNQAATTAKKQQIEVEFSSFSQIEVDVWLQANELIAALETAERFKNRCLTSILDAWKGV